MKITLQMKSMMKLGLMQQIAVDLAKKSKPFTDAEQDYIQTVGGSLLELQKAVNVAINDILSGMEMDEVKWEGLPECDPVSCMTDNDGDSFKGPF